MPIQIGDLVEYQGARWFVSQRHSGVRTVVLRQLDGNSQEIPNDDPEAKVIGNLPTQWPFIAVPKKTSPLVEITVARSGRTFTLEPMKAWVPADPLHNGGVLYFHPKIALRPGEVLVARHANGAVTRVNVTKSFGTVQRRMALTESKKPPPAPQTRYDHLMADEDEDA